MGEWTAIVLAGQRPGENGFAAAHGVAAKALIRAGGEPMLGRVARALLDSPSIGRIVVLAQEAEALLEGELGWMAAEPRISTARSGDGISASVGGLAGTAAAPYPVLVTTADHALLRPEMVETFIGSAAGVDVAFAMVERRVVEKSYPDTKRTWLKAANGHFSGANLFALGSDRVLPAIERWRSVERDRKKGWRVLSALGPALLLGAVLKLRTLQQTARAIGHRLGIDVRAVEMTNPLAAVDVDKQEDHALVEAILAGRA